MRHTTRSPLARKAAATIVLAALILSLTACGGERRNGSTLARIRKNGTMTVGVKADQPGIGSRNPGSGDYEGFDIEMARIVAKAIPINPDKIVFKEVVSKNREAFIKNGTVDMVVASYSISDTRRKQVGQVGPYYETRQQLLIRSADRNTITNPEKARGRKVCSAVGSSSIKKLPDLGAQPVPFSSYTECVQLLVSGSVDAVMTDGAILQGYKTQLPADLEILPQAVDDYLTQDPTQPTKIEKYGIGFRRGDTEFCDFLLATVQKSFDDGSWQGAFDATLGRKAGVTAAPPKLDGKCWETEKEETAAVQAAAKKTQSSDGSVLLTERNKILSGFRSTLALFLLAALCALAGGTVLATFRVSPIPALRTAGTAYVDVVRNTPLVLVFIFVTFGLPALGIQLSFFVRAVIALVVYTSAFVCEALRSGVNAVPPGQVEAARAVGLTFGQSLSMVVLPQAFRTAIPPLASILIALAKNTAVAEAFGVTEAAYQLDSLVRDYADQLWTLFIGIAFGYVVLTLALAGVARALESKVVIAR